MSSIKFGNDVYTRWDNDRLKFELTQPLDVRWFNDDGKLIVRFTVPAGFFTDLASIPRWATPIVPKLGHHLRSAVVHDWLYEYGESIGLTRIQCDDLFFDGMTLDGVSTTRRYIMYQAIRIGGGGLFGSEIQEPILEEFDND